MTDITASLVELAQRDYEMKTVVIESPFAGDTIEQVDRHLEYAQAAMLDCLQRGEAPFASHLLYTQVLDDNEDEQRGLGMIAGFTWGACADLVVVYQDLGLSPGMVAGITLYESLKMPIEYRNLEGWSS